MPTETARELLEDHWFSKVILNMQMHDPEDPEDDSGLELLRDEAYRSIPKFVVG